MKKTIQMLWEAFVFSLKFCWRNDRPNTVGRIATATLSTALQWATVFIVGALITAVQNVHAKPAPLVLGIVPEPIAWLLGGLGAVLAIEIVVSRFTWFCRNLWMRRLRFANIAEINAHKATLDYGRFKSAEFDEVKRRIEELPSSWDTRLAFSDEMLTFVSTAASFLLFGASLVWCSPAYAGLIFACAVPMAAWELVFANLWWKYFQEMVPLKKRRSVLEQVYRGPISFMQGILFGQMPTLNRRIDENTGEVISRARGLFVRAVRVEMALHLLAKASLWAVLVHAVFAATRGDIGLGNFTVVFAAARTFLSNLEAMVGLIGNQWISARGVNLIESEFFGLTPLLRRENPKPLAVSGAPELRFEHVSFAYPGKPDQLVLKDVSFTIRPGEKVALVGQSGGGKSSIAVLASLIYDPTSGRVLVDGQNLGEVSPADWHRHLGVLSQKSAILDRPMGEEVASSRIDEPIDMGAIGRAAGRARFTSVVEDDPDGWNSQLGTEFGGRDLSGGEEHRLALARVFYREAPCLILDEPDSRLDPRTASKVMHGIETLEGCTVLLVTHRVDRARFCDRILVVDGGEIVEYGTHDELIAKNGHYAGMLKKLPADH